MSKKEQMSAIVWDGGDYPGSLSLRHVDVPTPDAGWVRFRTEACGICGSDTHVVAGGSKYLVPKGNFPAVLGHENAGVVVDVGDGVTAVSPGDRIAVEPLHGCQQFGATCRMCEAGKYHLCLNGLVHVGLPLVRNIHGGFGEYSVAHESRCFRIPDDVSLLGAATLDIVAVCVHALNLSPPSVGVTALVMGCGIIGIDMIQVLRAAGIRSIIAVAKYEYQAAKAREKGASAAMVLDELAQRGVSVTEAVLEATRGRGADYVYECVGGDTDAVQQSLSACAYGGTVVMLGGASHPTSIDLQDMILKEHHLIASMSYAMHGPQREFQTALSMLAAGDVQNEDLITHTFTRNRFAEAFEVALNKREYHAFKVMFTT